MIYPILAYGHPGLKRKAKEIDKDLPGLDEFIKDMFETMYQSDGLGLAAPQVNKSIRLFVLDTKSLKEEHPEVPLFSRAFLNPTIREESGEEWEYKEACLSIPGISEFVFRKPIVRIRYYGQNFEFFDETYDGILARVIQHEYDHLEGILFVDRISNLSKAMIRGKLNDIKAGKTNAKYKMVYVRR